MTSWTIGEDARQFLRTWNMSRKPNLVLWLRLIFLTPGFQLIALLRVQNSVGRVPLIGTVLRRLVTYFISIYFAVDIEPGAELGAGVRFPHPTGIVIGARAKLGRGVVILQNVTIGQRHDDDKRMPVIGDGAVIGAGACIVGAITIGAGARIGANSVVTHDVPDGAVAAGVPARILAAR